MNLFMLKLVHIMHIRIFERLRLNVGDAFVGIEIDNLVPDELVTQLIQAKIAENREQPVLNIAVRPQASLCLYSTNARFLNEILCLGRIVDEGNCIAMQSIKQLIQN